MNPYLLHIIITLLIDYSDELFNTENFEEVLLQLCLNPYFIYKLLNNNTFEEVLLCLWYQYKDLILRNGYLQYLKNFVGKFIETQSLQDTNFYKSL